jgi:hypothetical protein
VSPKTKEDFMDAETEKKVSDYGAVLADLEAKKSMLERAIASLRAVMDSGALAVNAGDAMTLTDGLSSSVMASGEVPHGAFLGKSIPEAAKLYLTIAKRKQTSREIAEGLKKGGIESKSKSFNAQVHTILDRARKSGSGVFVKLDGGYWGLGEWYPAALRASTKPSKAKKSKKPTKRAAPQSKAKPTVAAPVPVVQTANGGATEKIAAILKAKPGAEHSAQELAGPLGLKVQVAHLLLGKLIKSKVAEKTASGKYRAAIAA